MDFREWVCVDGNEATARVAYALSEVVASMRGRAPFR